MSPSDPNPSDPKSRAPEPSADALFLPVGDGRFRATTASVGPWDPRALHGGPPGALIAGALEDAVAELGDFVPVRVTVELLRPVPVDVDLDVQATIRRPGRKVCVADATIAQGDTVLMAATLQGIRAEAFDHGWHSDLATPAGPDTGVAHVIDGPAVFHNSAVEHRYLNGTSFTALGPATDWIRLRVPVVAGVDTSPLQRVLAAADFGNGISGLFPMDEVTFINPDLSVFLYRLPVGEWVCLDAVTRLGPTGTGIAESVLYDEQGPIGRAVQTLLMEKQ